MASEIRINGSVAPGFEPVAEAFERNFSDLGEYGASVCIRRGGHVVVDLWGGAAQDGSPWQRDTICTVYSCTKAATAVCLHLLASRSLVDLDRPVATYWPEFAQAGKDAITLRMLLDHSAGLPALRAPLKPDCLLDWDYMTDQLARVEPFWEPGTRVGYHAITFGFLVGEVIRRVSGQTPGRFFRDAVARPLGLDFSIGLDPGDLERVAPIIPYRPGPEERAGAFLSAAMQPGTIQNLFLFNSGTWAATGVNTPEGMAAEIPAANGVSNARGLAGLFDALLGGGAALGLQDTATATFAQASSASHRDATLLTPTRFGPGFMLSMGRQPGPGGVQSLALGRQAFGHVGMGGSVGFADPECGLAFGYAMNRLGGGLLLNARGQGLIDAAYRCLGHKGGGAGAGSCWLPADAGGAQRAVSSAPAAVAGSELHP